MWAEVEVVVEDHSKLASRFCWVSFNTQNLYCKHRKIFAPLPFIPNEEEFNFIWVQFQLPCLLHNDSSDCLTGRDWMTCMKWPTDCLNDPSLVSRHTDSSSSSGLALLKRVECIDPPINQSNLYTTNIPGKARLSGVTAKSVFNSKIEETVP